MQNRIHRLTAMHARQPPSYVMLYEYCVKLQTNEDTKNLQNKYTVGINLHYGLYNCPIAYAIIHTASNTCLQINTSIQT